MAHGRSVPCARRVPRHGRAGRASRGEELVPHGAQLILCWQTAGNRRIAQEELLPSVRVALSAMRAVEYRQSSGYQLIRW